jgi:hypothetical protein
MKRETVGWVVVAVAACKSAHKAPPALKSDLVSGSGNVAEVQLGPPNPGGDRELAFAITKVYERQKPTSAPPYHVPGGTWTYFDAKLAVDPAATFTAGWPKLDAGEGGFGGFSKMWLVPTTSEAGTHFVAAFAKAFHVTAPPAHPGTLAPMLVPIAVLAVGTDASEDGYGGEGTWDATKMFLSADDVDSAELFYNVSIAGKQGVFSEKDEDYDKDDLYVLAIALRDGNPPPRTPENDPTLAARPLTLELGKQVGARHVWVVGNSAKRALVTEPLDDVSVLRSIDLATGVVKELYRTPEQLVGNACDASAEHCVVQQIHSNDRHSYSLSDPSKLLLIEGNKVTPLLVPGTGTSPHATTMSPSGRFVIVDGDGIVIFDRKTGKASSPEKTKEFREIVAWRSDTVALASSEDLAADNPVMHYGVWHIDTGVFEPIATAAAGLASPDGARTAAFAAGKLTVTSKAGAARTLQFDRRDARFAEAGCCKWLDSRYLTFPTQRFGVIDTDAMKVAFVPAPLPDEEQRIEPLPGTMQALVTNGEATYLARIVP